MTQELLLQVGDDTIYLTLDGNAGAIRSTFKDYLEPEDVDPTHVYEHMIDGIESLVLAHACAGVDVMSEKYRAGIQSAIDAIIFHG